jgi:hypothetical protein
MERRPPRQLRELGLINAWKPARRNSLHGFVHPLVKESRLANTVDQEEAHTPIRSPGFRVQITGTSLPDWLDR